MLLRYIRRKEVEAFRDADMVDFRAFKQTLEKRGENTATSIMLAKAQQMNPGIVSQLPADQRLPSPEDTLAPETRLYALKPRSFDEVTRNMITMLHVIVPNRAIVIRNALLAEFARSENQDLRLQNTTIPFLICTYPDLSVICGVRLREMKGSSSDLVKSVFGDLGKPLLDFPLSNNISEAEIRVQLDPILTTALMSDASRNCPKCGEKMAMRKSVKGRNSGEMYWVCTRFPGCRSVIQI